MRKNDCTNSKSNNGDCSNAMKITVWGIEDSNNSDYHFEIYKMYRHYTEHGHTTHIPAHMHTHKHMCTTLKTHMYIYMLSVNDYVRKILLPFYDSRNFISTLVCNNSSRTNSKWTAISYFSYNWLFLVCFISQNKVHFHQSTVEILICWSIYMRNK